MRVVNYPHLMYTKTTMKLLIDVISDVIYLIKTLMIYAIVISPIALMVIYKSYKIIASRRAFRILRVSYYKRFKNLYK